MPDWSYHPIFKPVLFSLNAKTAQRIILGSIGTLASMPGGRHVIQFLGHMEPAKELSKLSAFRSPIGLGCGFDLDKNSATALSDFGFGFIEIGPITVEPIDGALARDADTERITLDDVPANRGLEFFTKQFGSVQQPVPLIARVAHKQNTTAEVAREEFAKISSALSKCVSRITLDTRWSVSDWSDSDLENYLRYAVSSCEKLLVLLPIDSDQKPFRHRLVDVGIKSGINGFVLSGGIKSGDRRTFGAGALQTAIEAVSEVRNLAPNALLVAGGGVMQPVDSMRLLDAGANLIELYSGLVFSGPGLPKRTNELLAARLLIDEPDIETSYRLPDILNSSWLFLACFGLGLVSTCIAAITVGLTTVILPYDETFVKLHREAFNAINPHLLHFMEHDRVTYAGTSLSTGLLFAALAIFGIRKGHHWAFAAVRNAGFFGQCSFLLFLGFHYLDPLHALVTMILLPFYLWGVFAKKTFRSERAWDFENTAAWRRSLLGQFLFVAFGIGLMLAGATICYVGTSTVFVPEDLMFMHTTCNALLATNPQLLPAIAHDRAGFGGSLFTIGIAVLISALHGFRRGEGWLWWTFALCALPAFISTVAIHYSIGYTNMWHLTPVYIAFVMYVFGIILSYDFLCQPVQSRTT